MSEGEKFPRLTLVGDVAVEYAEPEELLEKIAPYFRQSAIAFCNCEWALTDRGEPWPGKAGRIIRSHPRNIQTFIGAGFDVVTLANNHVMNYGPDGLIQTLELLDGAGIKHCGAGMNLEEAHRPAIVEWNGLKVAFLGYTSVFIDGFEAAKDKPGMAVLRIESSYRIPPRLHEVPGLPMVVETIPNRVDSERMQADIAAARDLADAVVVSFHWGVSQGYQHLVQYQKIGGRAAIDAGADLVVGHHPHTVQPVEIYKGKVIAYSLAHCGFDMKSAHHSSEGIAIEVPLDGPAFGFPQVRPIANAAYRPELIDMKNVTSCHDWLSRMSQSLGTEFIVEGEALTPRAMAGDATPA